MRLLATAKSSVENWLEKLDKLNMFKLFVGLTSAALYILSGFVPVIGQYVLCGVLIVVSFVSFSSILLSLSGVSINKLEPIENFFKKAHETWEGEDNG